MMEKLPFHESIVLTIRMLGPLMSLDPIAQNAHRSTVSHSLTTSLIPAGHDKIISALRDLWPDDGLTAKTIAAVEAEKARVEAEWDVAKEEVEEKTGLPAVELEPMVQSSDEVRRGRDGLTCEEREAKLQRDLVALRKRGISVSVIDGETGEWVE